MRRIATPAVAAVLLALGAFVVLTAPAGAHVVDGQYRSDVTAANCGSYDACGSGQSGGGSSDSTSSSSSGAPPASISSCESGNSPSAVSPSGLYRGKWQFDRQTWASVGGSGDPAAASESEQDRRAGALYAQRGSSPWPTCG